jgi:hypothetical protein
VRTGAATRVLDELSANLSLRARTANDGYVHVSGGKSAGVGAGVGAIIGIGVGALVGHSTDLFATTIYKR